MLSLQSVTFFLIVSGNGCHQLFRRAAVKGQTYTRFPKPVGLRTAEVAGRAVVPAAGALSTYRTPTRFGEVHITCTRRRVFENVSWTMNDLGSHSLSGTISSAPPLEMSAIRHANDFPSSSSILAGRLTGCRSSLRMTNVYKDLV
jgi:hypothetical protein